MNNMQFGSDLDEGIWQRNWLFFPENPIFSNSAFALSSLWAFALQSDEKKILAPCLVNHRIYISIGAHSSSERSQTIRGHFLNFYRGLVQKHWAAGRRKTTMHSLPSQIYPSQLWRCTRNAALFTNRTEFSTRCWQLGERLNWIGNQNWRPVGKITFYQLY